MSIIKLVSFTLFIFTFSVLSEEEGKYSNLYEKCLSANLSNPMSTNCTDAEINFKNEEINNTLSVSDKLISPENGSEINLNSYALGQHKAIEEKCIIWLQVGGQNGVLLEKQCILDETVSLKKLLADLVTNIDG